MAAYCVSDGGSWGGTHVLQSAPVQEVDIIQTIDVAIGHWQQAFRFQIIRRKNRERHGSSHRLRERCQTDDTGIRSSSSRDGTDVKLIKFSLRKKCLALYEQP